MNEIEQQATVKPAEELIIEVKSMHKWYGDFHVLSDINLHVQLGERIVICGPSGSGKSTLIRCINRLEEHQRGQIIVNHSEHLVRPPHLHWFIGKAVVPPQIGHDSPQPAPESVARTSAPPTTTATVNHPSQSTQR